MRLSVRAAAKSAGVSQQAITQAMDEWISSRGRRGLRHVDDGEFATKSGESRRQRWTTDRWIEEWEDRLAESTLGSAPKTNVTPVPNRNGVLPGRTRDLLRQMGHYQR